MLLKYDHKFKLSKALKNWKEAVQAKNSNANAQMIIQESIIKVLLTCQTKSHFAKWK